MTKAIGVDAMKRKIAELKAALKHERQLKSHYKSKLEKLEREAAKWTSLNGSHG